MAILIYRNHQESLKMTSDVNKIIITDFKGNKRTFATSALK